MVIWPTLEPSSRHHRAATSESSSLMDSRYVGDNHEPKSGQNGLVTKREIESEGDPLERGRRVWLMFLSVRFNTYTYICVCIVLSLYGTKKKERKEKKKKKKEEKERKRKRKRKRKEKEKKKKLEIGFSLEISDDLFQ